MKHLLLFFSISAMASIPVENFPLELKGEFKLNERMSCLANTGGKFTRFNYCRPGNEVMVGIQSLEPLVVYCTNLVINCRQTDSNDVSHQN